MKLGLPAPNDVAALATMLKSLIDLVQDQLGHNITGAVTFGPRFPALYQEDVFDAFSYLGRSPHLKISSWGQPHSQPSAAFAGYGFGLCSHIVPEQRCNDEIGHMPETRVRAISWTRESIISALPGFAGALMYGLQLPQPNRLLTRRKVIYVNAPIALQLGPKGKRVLEQHHRRYPRTSELAMAEPNSSRVPLARKICLRAGVSVEP